MPVTMSVSIHANDEVSSQETTAVKDQEVYAYFNSDIKLLDQFSRQKKRSCHTTLPHFSNGIGCIMLHPVYVI